jgi:hypothetical protein
MSNSVSDVVARLAAVAKALARPSRWPRRSLGVDGIGRPSIQRRSCSIDARGMTTEGRTSAFSQRGALEECECVNPQENKGAGKAGCVARTHSPACKIKSIRVFTTGSSRTTGVPCAMVLTGYVVLAPVRPAFVSPSLVPHRDANLAPATGAPGPHAFAVRLCAARRTAHSRPSPPASTSVTTRPPLNRGGMGGGNHHFTKNGRDIFSRGGWTIAILFGFS